MRGRFWKAVSSEQGSEQGEEGEGLKVPECMKSQNTVCGGEKVFCVCERE